MLQINLNRNQDLQVITLNTNVEEGKENYLLDSQPAQNESTSHYDTKRRIIEASLGVSDYSDILTLPKIEVWKS